jgi:hypothetical protein
MTWLWTLFICWISSNLILVCLLFLFSPGEVEVGDEEWAEWLEWRAEWLKAEWERRLDANHRRGWDGWAPLRLPDASPQAQDHREPGQASEQPLGRASVPVPLGR